MMADYIKVGNLQVAPVLYEFINTEGLPESKLDQEQFWADFEKLVHDLASRNKELFVRRDEIQTKINTWHRENML
jgi:malate synthase